MTLAPFAPGAFTNRRSADHFVQMRNQGTDLERQLSTGRRADSYAGLGVKRGPALDMRAKLNGLESFQNNIKDANLRMSMLMQSVEGLDKVSARTRSMLVAPASNVFGGGVPQEQIMAQGDLKLAIDMLNADINGRHLFAGREHDERPVVGYETMMEDLRAAVGAPDPADPDQWAEDIVTAVNAFFDNAANWYSGDDPSLTGNPRTTSTVQIDQGRSAAMGAQANEPAFTQLLKQLAAVAVADFPPGSGDHVNALTREIRSSMPLDPPESPTISQIGIELGAAQVQMKTADEQHRATGAMLRDQLGDIEDARTEEVAAKLLTLQTRLQASYQTTSMLSRLSLVNFL
jgi:flagellin-like hook-associated protein FlgL